MTTAPTCACSPGRGELFARLCPGPTPGACRVGYGAGDGTDEPCDCRCHDVPPPEPKSPAAPPLDET